MEFMWFFLLAACLLLPLVFILLSRLKICRHLPPGPASVPLLGNPVWFTVSDGMDFMRTLRGLHSRHGPLLTLRMGSFLDINVADRRLAHVALVERGAALANRPELASRDLFSHNPAFTITSSNYGPLWRQLRRNFVVETASAARIHQFAPARELVLAKLTERLARHNSLGAVSVVDKFHHAMQSLLVAMCFGELVDELAVSDLTAALHELMMYSITQLNVFVFLPTITPWLFRGRIQAMRAMREKIKNIYLPLIDARRERKRSQGERGAPPPQKETAFLHSYVDSLLDMELNEDRGRALTEDEIASLCTEFLTVGTDLPVSALQWTMAELVKNPAIQEKLYAEIKATATSSNKHGCKVSEEDLPKMPYLKAVVLESLRRHPPAHQLVPHSAAEDVDLGGYMIPKGASLNTMIFDIGMDRATWESPGDFRPERFLPGGDGEGVDITGTREIKMMPFGAGRRICPGLAVAMLHLEYFIANLVAAFEWQEAQGEEVDVISMKPNIGIDMEKPLRPRIVARG